jgi:hypothetical protein
MIVPLDDLLPVPSTLSLFGLDKPSDREQKVQQPCFPSSPFPLES